MDELKLGVEHFNAGRFREALTMFQAARDRGERGPELRCFLAHALDALGQPRQAIIAFIAVIAEFPRHLPAYAGLSGLVVRQGPGELSAPDLRGLLSLKPFSPESRRELVGLLKACASAFYAANDLPDAEGALRRILALEPEQNEHRARLIALMQVRAQRHQDARDYDAAETMLRRALALDRADEGSRRLLSELLRLRAQDLQAPKPAERSLREALRLQPRDDKARHKLLELLRARSQKHLRAGASAPAERDLRRALSLAPGDKETRRRLEALLRARFETALSANAPAAAGKALRAALAVSRDKKALRELALLLRRRGKADLSSGRLDAAEKALREALRLQPHDENARHKLLELLRRRARSALRGRKIDLAQTLLRRALAVDPRDKEIRGRLLDLMHAQADERLRANSPAAAESILRRALAFEPEDGRARRRLVDLAYARLESALKSSRPAAVDKALRAALAISSDADSRRHLAELLRARGLAALFARRLEPAMRFFQAVLRCDPAYTAAAMSLASALNAAGRTAEEKATLARVVKQARGRHALGDKFKALMRLRRFQEALDTAESILDGTPALSDLRCFWDPWDWDERVPREERARELSAMESALGTRPRGPWLHFFRGALIGPESLAHFGRLAPFSRKRYGWMYFKAGLTALAQSEFHTATAWFKIALAAKPADWRAHCFLAETCLCLGKPRAAFAEMDRALAAAPDSEKGQVLAWRGAFELWLGRYRPALGLLNKAAALGAQCAYCWKGAALLKLGKPAEALEELNRTINLFPLDFEAYIWRGEAKYQLGLYREALRDLDERAAKDSDRPTPMWLWARFNRALVKAALKDEAGMIEDFNAIPKPVLAYIREKTGLTRREDILSAGLRLSRGFRRDEYGQAIWMRPRATA